MLLCDMLLLRMFTWTETVKGNMVSVRKPGLANLNQVQEQNIRERLGSRSQKYAQTCNQQRE